MFNLSLPMVCNVLKYSLRFFFFFFIYSLNSWMKIGKRENSPRSFIYSFVYFAIPKVENILFHARDNKKKKILIDYINY